MARYMGDSNQVGFFYESGTYAVKSGAQQWLGEVVNHSVNEEVNATPLRYVGTSSRNVSKFIDGALDYGGNITFHPQDWKSVMFALGSIADGGSPSPYTHTIKELNSDTANAFTSGTLNPFISFSLEDAQPAQGTGKNFIRTVEGAIVNTLSISASQGEMITCELNYVAQNITFSSGAATAITAATTTPFLWNNCTLHIPSGTVYEGLLDFGIEINNNLERAHYLTGSRVTQAPIPQNRDYALNITLHGTSERTKTLYDQYYLGGSTFNAMLQVDASTGSRDAFFIMSGCKLTAMDAPTSAEGPQEQSITIMPQSMVLSVNDAIFKYAPW